MYFQLNSIIAAPNSTKIKVALGRRVGLYRFCGDIGRGNFSKVKLAVHQLTRDKVAIKVVDRGGLDTRALRMLSREVATLECVHHPNILRLFEVVETLGRVYLVTEWVRGGEMYNHITQGGPLRELHAAPLFKQLLLAVKHMHSLGFVHRDIKAENVLLVSESRLKLADFGFSTELISGHNQKLDTFCGSPPYAAPELFSDDNYIGVPVDVWALGVLLYFMVVGNMPFRAPTVPQLRSAVLKGDYTIPGHITLPCQRLIQRILVYIPAGRPTIDEILSSQWISQPNLSVELMQREINEQTKATKKSSFWCRSKPRRLRKSYSIRDRYLEVTNKPQLQLSTKRAEGVNADNYLHPIDTNLVDEQHKQSQSHQNQQQNQQQQSSSIIDNQGSNIKRSIFSGNLKKKVGPIENEKSYMNNEIRYDDQRSIILESPTLKNYDEEKGKFIMLPTDTNDYSKLNELEIEARDILDKLGIKSDILRDSIKNGPRSDIIGAYRIVINRLQKQAWLAKRQAIEQLPQSEPTKNSKRNRGCTIL